MFIRLISNCAAPYFLLFRAVASSSRLWEKHQTVWLINFLRKLKLEQKVKEFSIKSEVETTGSIRNGERMNKLVLIYILIGRREPIIRAAILKTKIYLTVRSI